MQLRRPSSLLGMGTRNMHFHMTSCTRYRTVTVIRGIRTSIKQETVKDLHEYRNGWGASAVDAFSTAIVMQIPEIVDTIVEFIPTIDFNVTNSEISLFETTIRYVGGMLSGKTRYHMKEANTDISKATTSYQGRYPI
jgi:hypothetical protein